MRTVLCTNIIEKETMLQPISVEIESMIDEIMRKRRKQLKNGIKLEIFVCENQDDYEVTISEGAE